MRFSAAILVTILLAPTFLTAQEPASLPPIVQQHIDDETILVARLNLTQSGANNVSAFLAELPDPSNWFGLRAVDFHTVLSNLQSVRKKNPERFVDLFIVISTNDLPLNSLLLVVPVTGTAADRQAVLDAFKGIGTGTTESIAGGVVHWTGQARVRGQATTKLSRAEFANALLEIKNSHLQFAISPGPDARRVLREFWPVLPAELGGGSGSDLVNELRWMALGINPTDKPELRFVGQGGDEQYVAAAEKVIRAAVQLLAESSLAKASSINANKLLELLQPTRKDSRLVIAVDESNTAQAALLNELAAPLIVRLQRNSLISRTVSNLKNLGLQMHNYHDAYGRFPAPAKLSMDGKQLLSWRVELLPYLGHSALYKEFHLNEPWDSEHNRRLIPRMPDLFASSNISEKQRAQGLTTYLGISSDKCLFAGPEGKKIKDIKDGISNTICIVDANSDRAVIWTQPVDLQIDLANPLLGLDGQPEGSFQAVMCDGSVRAFSYTLKPETVRRLFQIDDGKPIEE